MKNRRNKNKAQFIKPEEEYAEIHHSLMGRMREQYDMDPVERVQSNNYNSMNGNFKANNYYNQNSYNNQQQFNNNASSLSTNMQTFNNSYSGNVQNAINGSHKSRVSAPLDGQNPSKSNRWKWSRKQGSQPYKNVNYNSNNGFNQMQDSNFSNNNQAFVNQNQSLFNNNQSFANSKPQNFNNFSQQQGFNNNQNTFNGQHQQASFNSFNQQNSFNRQNQHDSFSSYKKQKPFQSPNTQPAFNSQNQQNSFHNQNQSSYNNNFNNKNTNDSAFSFQKNNMQNTQNNSFSQNPSNLNSANDSNSPFMTYNEQQAKVNQGFENATHISKNSKNKPKKKRSMFKTFLTLLIMVAVIFVGSWLLREFVFSAYEIPSGSMEKTIMTGDMVFAEKVTKNFAKPQKGDIVTFEDPLNPGRILIKRIVATEGQEVDIKGNSIYVDGEELDEDYVRGLPTTALKSSKLTYPYTVPSNCSWVMGDNRTNSQDSRYYGAISNDTIYGKALFVYWPFSNWKSLN